MESDQLALIESPGKAHQTDFDGIYALTVLSDGFDNAVERYCYQLTIILKYVLVLAYQNTKTKVHL